MTQPIDAAAARAALRRLKLARRCIIKACLLAWAVMIASLVVGQWLLGVSHPLWFTLAAPSTITAIAILSWRLHLSSAEAALELAARRHGAEANQGQRLG